MTSVSLSYSAASSPSSSFGSSANQASMPAFSTRVATSSSSSCVRGCSAAVCLCTNSASGTPQVRWREMHQSGRFSIMLVMRCSPQAGVQRTRLMSRSALRAQTALIHADEPLRRGAEDQRRLVAPAMRVAVPQRLLVQQRTSALELLHHDGIGVVDAQTSHQRRVGDEAAVRPHRIDHRQAVACSRLRSPPGRAPAPCAPRRCRHRASRARRE